MTVLPLLLLLLAMPAIVLAQITTTDRHGLQITTHTNSVLHNDTSSTTNVGAFDTNVPLSKGALSIEWSGVYTPAATAAAALRCSVSNITGGARRWFVWLNDELICHHGSEGTPGVPSEAEQLQGRRVGHSNELELPPTYPLVAGEPYVLRGWLSYDGNGTAAGADAAAGFSVALTIADAAVGGTPRPLPLSELSPLLPAAELQRQGVQRGLLTGWGSWSKSMLEHVLLPEQVKNSHKDPSSVNPLSNPCCSSLSIAAGADLAAGDHLQQALVPNCWNPEMD